MRFKVFAASVHGKKYRERGLPCQDSFMICDSGDVADALQNQGGSLNAQPDEVW